MKQTALCFFVFYFCLAVCKGQQADPVLADSAATAVIPDSLPGILAPKVSLMLMPVNEQHLLVHSSIDLDKYSRFVHPHLGIFTISYGLSSTRFRLVRVPALYHK